MKNTNESAKIEVTTVDAEALKKALKVTSKLRAGIVPVVGRGGPISGGYCLTCGRGL